MNIVARLFATVLAAMALLAPGVAAQDLPPGPAALQPLARMPIEGGTGPISEVQTLLLDFAPGAWTPLHSHGGLTLVRVLEGEMTRRRGGVDDVFRGGEGWLETPGDVHAAGNNATTPARIQVTVLLPPGAPLTTVAGTPSAGAPPGPTTAYQSRRVPAFMNTSFGEVATTVLGFAPGAWTPVHSHGGLTLVAVVEGEMRVRTLRGETTYRAGDLWVERPGDVHAAGNVTSGDAVVAVTFLLRPGDPVTTIAANQTIAQLPSALPRTGAPAPSHALLAIAALTLLGAGLRLRRRAARA